MSGLLPIQLNYGDDSEVEEGECEDDSVTLKRILNENVQIQEMMKSSNLKDLIKTILVKYKQKQSNQQQKKSNFGLQTWEQSILKDYILQSKEFKNLIEILMEILSKFDADQKS